MCHRPVSSVRQESSLGANKSLDPFLAGRKRETGKESAEWKARFLTGRTTESGCFWDHLLLGSHLERTQLLLTHYDPLMTFVLSDSRMLPTLFLSAVTFSLSPLGTPPPTSN